MMSTLLQALGVVTPTQR